MKTYSVECVEPSGKTVSLEDCVADGVMPEMPHRFFVDKHGNRFEVPYEGVKFRFSKERQEVLEQNAHKDAEGGQP